MTGADLESRATSSRRRLPAIVDRFTARAYDFYAAGRPDPLGPRKHGLPSAAHISSQSRVYLLYVDESGSIADPNLKYFVLAGFCLFERQGYWISKKLDEIAARFDAVDPAAVELHGSPMRQGRGDFWPSFPLPDRIKAMEDALSILATSHPSNRIFVVAVQPSSVAPEDAVAYAFEQLASRFDQYLMRLHRKGDTQRGLIIFDKTAYETSIQGLATNFRSEGHRWGVLRNLAEVPLFLDSKASRLIQLADLVAYGALRHFDRNDSQLFEIFQHRIDREGRTLHGLHHR